MQRDVRGLASAIERRPEQKRSVSPLAVVASAVGALFVGAAGMSLYDSKSEAPAEPAARQAELRADLQAAMAPYTLQLEKITQTLVAAQQSTAEDSKAHGLLLDDLSKTVTSLQKSAEAQNAAFHERVELLADELAAKIADNVRAQVAPTVAARPSIPDSKASAVQPATAETEATDAEATDADDGLVAVDKPIAPTANEPERGELIIDNPSNFDLKLLINGEPLDIKARGVTTIDVSVGTVKTQIASLPDLVQTWDQWEMVDGVQQLKINVESGGDYYKLQ